MCRWRKILAWLVFTSLMEKVKFGRWDRIAFPGWSAGPGALNEGFLAAAWSLQPVFYMWEHQQRGINGGPHPLGRRILARKGGDRGRNSLPHPEQPAHDRPRPWCALGGKHSLRKPDAKVREKYSASSGRIWLFGKTSTWWYWFSLHLLLNRFTRYLWTKFYPLWPCTAWHVNKCATVLALFVSGHEPFQGNQYQKTSSRKGEKKKKRKIL